MSRVKLEVVEIPNSTMDVKSSKGKTKKILPGVTQTLAPVMDSFGRIVTGVTKTEYDEIMSHNAGVTQPLEYNDYYKNFCVKVTDKGREFDLTVPKHQLIYKFLQTIPEVAESYKKVNPSIHTYYLINEEAEAEKKLSKIDMKMKAYTYLNEMSSDDIVDFLVLYGKNTKSVSPALAKAKLGEYIEKDPKTFIEKYTDNNRQVRTELRQMVIKGVVRKEGPAHFYGDEGDSIFLGGSEELAVEFLKDIKNQDLYRNLLEILEK